MYALGNILKRHPAKRNIGSLSLRISNYWYSSSAALIGDDWLEDQCNDIPSVHVHMHGLSAMHTDGHKFIPYPTGHAWQHKCLNEQLKHERELRKGCSSNVTRHNPLNDKIFIIQHDHVYTLGRGADENHLTFLNKFCEKDNEVRQDMRKRLSRQARGKDSARLDSASASHSNKTISPVLAPNGVPIYRVERGGEVTYHGPGQLVVYPMLNLRRHPHKQDLHWYLRMVEEVIIKTLSSFGITGVRDEINTGVWVGQEKIAAVGVNSSRWITTHGFAINVMPDLSYFDTSIILPCGIDGRGVTSMAKELNSNGKNISLLSLEKVAFAIVKSFEEVFNVRTNRLNNGGSTCNE